MNESLLLQFNYLLPGSGKGDAYGDRKLSQRWPHLGWGRFPSSSQISPQGRLCGSLWFTQGHLTILAEPNLLIIGMLDRGYFF